MVNISVMLWLYKQGIPCVAADDLSVMEIVGENEVSIDSSYPYFSLLCIDGEAGGVNISGAKFPLNAGTVTPTYQYATSNEVLPGGRATVSVKNGVLLLIKVKRDYE
jgi:thiamine pyrophosphokinase